MRSRVSIEDWRDGHHLDPSDASHHARATAFAARENGFPLHSPSEPAARAR